MALRSISPSRLTLRSSPSVISKVKSLPSLTSKPPLVRPLVAPSSPARHAHAHFTSYGTKPREPDIHGFYHRPTGSWQYIVVGARFTSHTTEVPRAAAILDPVLDYDPASGRVSTATADELVDFVKGKGLRVTHILETHAHADHLSAARYLQARWQGEFDATQSSSSTSDGDEGSRRVHICIGEHIRAVQQTFLPRYAPPSAHARWDLEHAFDQLLKEGDTLLLGGEGGSRIKVLHLPGHTPDHVAYVVEGHAFVGDTFFMPEAGTARTDFPGGSASTLYRSLRKLLSLPDSTYLYTGHDYPPADGRPPACRATVSEHEQNNVALSRGRDSAASSSSDELEDAFVAWRNSRDAQLGAPRLLHPALQVNIAGGRLPPPGEDGIRRMRVPLTLEAGPGLASL